MVKSLVAPFAIPDFAVDPRVETVSSVVVPRVVDMSLVTVLLESSRT